MGGNIVCCTNDSTMKQGQLKYPGLEDWSHMLKYPNRMKALSDMEVNKDNLVQKNDYILHDGAMYSGMIK